MHFRHPENWVCFAGVGEVVDCGKSLLEIAFQSFGQSENWVCLNKWASFGLRVTSCGFRVVGPAPNCGRRLSGAGSPLEKKKNYYGSICLVFKERGQLGERAVPLLLERVAHLR